MSEEREEALKELSAEAQEMGAYENGGFYRELRYKGTDQNDKPFIMTVKEKDGITEIKEEKASNTAWFTCHTPLIKKQQERREFVKAYVLAIINGYHANGCHGGSEDVNFLHITEDGARRFDILDKQLTELEEKEEK